MSKVIITESHLSDIADAIRGKNGQSAQYTPGQMAAAIEAIPTGGAAVLDQLSVTQNGTYTPGAGVDGFDEVVVNVSGGSGVVLSGTAAPTAAIGNNEDLYIQYSAHQGWDYLYGIDAMYRKVNGAWVAYVDPEDPNMAVHVWTQSTGGFDAAMYVQKASYDPSTGNYTPVGDAVVVIYTSVQEQTYDLFGLATLKYNSSWIIKATANITDGTQTYSSGDTVATWAYNTTKDVYLRRP